MRLLEALKFGKPHGLKGEVRASVFLQPENFHILSSLKKENSEPFSKIEVRSFLGKNLYIIKIENINNRNQAEELKNITLYYDPRLLPKLDNEEYYSYQLKGLEVYTKEDKRFGFVKEVHNFGAGDILEIALIDENGNPNNKTEMFSFSNKNFPIVSMEKRKIIIDPPIVL